MKPALVAVAFLLLLTFSPAVILAQLRSNATTSAATRAKDKVQERRTEIASRAAERNTAVVLRQEELTAKKEKVASEVAKRKGELRLKLKTFKDQKKAQLAQRIDENLNKVNENRTNAMLNQLEQIGRILGKVEDRTASASANGQDMTSVESAIDEATVTISEAKAGVQEQSTKSYNVSATSEAKLRENVQAQRDALHSDLKAVHQLVKDARESVLDSIEVLASVLQGASDEPRSN